MLNSKDVEVIETNKSSVIAEIGYDKQLNHLFVRFKGNRVYQYHDVPLDVFEKMKEIVAKGESIGKYFSKHIRKKYLGIRM